MDDTDASARARAIGLAAIAREFGAEPETALATALDKSEDQAARALTAQERQMRREKRRLLRQLEELQVGERMKMRLQSTQAAARENAAEEAHA